MPQSSCGFADLFRRNQQLITRRIFDRGSRSMRRLPWMINPFLGTVEPPLNQRAKLCATFDGAPCLMMVGFVICYALETGDGDIYDD